MGQKATEKLKKNINTLFIPIIGTIFLLIISFYLLGLPTIKNTMLISKKEMIKELTITVTELVNDYNRRYESGEFSLEEAQHRAKERVRTLRYGTDKKSYFWINDMMPTMLMHPYNPELENKNLAEYKDADGEPLFLNFLRIASTDGEGFLEYKWQFKDNSDKISKKISYVFAYKPWDWIIGTGIYIDEIDNEISALTNKMIFGFSLIMLVLLGVLYYLFGRSSELARVSTSFESKYEESEQYYRKIFDALNDAVIVYDFSNGEVIDVNSSGNQMFGFAKSELKDFEIFGEDELPAFRFFKTSINEGSLTFEKPIYKKDGIKIFSEVHLRISKLSGRKCIIVVIKDITSRVK